MKKSFHTKKTFVLWMLVTAVTFSGMTSQIPHAVHAQETNDIEESAISLAQASNITVDTAGSVTRIYGNETTTYHVPINITASCTVILDHVYDSADLTVANGAHVEIRLRGTNALHDICARDRKSTRLNSSH